MRVCCCCCCCQFGSRGRQYLVRFLHSTVAVRVGGGWMQLSEFLDANDPCRGHFYFLTLLTCSMYQQFREYTFNFTFG